MHSCVSTGPSLSDLPAEVDVPASGRNPPEMGLKIVREVGTTTKLIVNHYELQSLPTNKNLPVPTMVYNLIDHDSYKIKVLDPNARSWVIPKKR